jgi:xylan 1,4-beta-xylosidase
LHDEPYAAAFIVKSVMEANGYVDGYSFWTFSDIFEENYFPSVPFHGGFGLLSVHSIPKPSYRAFQLLHELGERLILVDGIHETVNCWMILKDNIVTVLMTNQANPGHRITQETANIHIRNLPPPREIDLQRIDESNANPKEVWKRKGSPEYLSKSDVIEIREKSQIIRRPLEFSYQDQTVHLQLKLPPHSVASATIRI